MPARVAIIYFGSTSLRDLYEKVLQFDTYPIVVPNTVTAEELALLDPQAIILTGSSSSYVNHPKAKTLDPAIYDLPVPTLGICYGMQRMAVDLGGSVKRMGSVEKGMVGIKFEGDSVLFRDIAGSVAATWMSHGSKVTTLPESFVVRAKSKRCVAAMENTERGLYGVQFHPEYKGKSTSASQTGTSLIWNFLNGVCGIHA